MSSQAEQSSVVLGEPSPAQVSASVFSRSLIKAVLLRSTAAAAEGPQGRAIWVSYTGAPAQGHRCLVSTRRGLHTVNGPRDQLELLRVPASIQNHRLSEAERTL